MKNISIKELTDMLVANSKKQMKGSESNSCEPRKIVDCDRESWIKSRVLTAMRMAMVLKHERYVQADDDLFNSGLEGIANGAAVEIIRELNLEPEYKNLRRVGDHCYRNCTLQGHMSNV